MRNKFLEIDVEGLAQRVADCVEKLGGQNKAARAIGISGPGLRKWIVDQKPPQSFAQLAKLVALTGRSLDWLATGIETSAAGSAAAVLPRYDVTPAGELKAAERDLTTVTFSRELLERNGAHIESTIAMIVIGRDMEPAIRDRSIIAVDRSDAPHMQRPGIYVFIQGGRMTLMRCEPLLGGGVDVAKDNAANSLQRIPADKIPALNVVGRVVLAVSEP